MSLSESLKTAGKAVAYFPRLAKPLGSVNASILFGHFFYWSDKGSSELGIYRTAEEIEAETGLTRDEQRTARAKLRERGVLIETEKRIEHRIYYKLDLSAFDELMKNFQACANPQTAKSTIPNPEVGNSQSGSGEFPAVYKNRRLQQKITTEIYIVGDEKNGKAGEIETKMGYEEKPDAEADSFVAAEAATQSPKVGNLKTKSARPTAENKKRFERIVDVYNRVFADCPMVSCVALTKVPNPKDGALEYTKVNQERLKLIPYAWEFAKLRLDGWKDDSGLIDGEQPSSKHVLMWFETYFTECLADGFINGSQPRSKAHENWKADFNYMMKRETLEKRVLEK